MCCIINPDLKVGVNEMDLSFYWALARNLQQGAKEKENRYRL